MYKSDLILLSEDEIRLTQLVDGNNKVIAEAELINYSTKEVYNPLTEKCAQVFSKNGYCLQTLKD